MISKFFNKNFIIHLFIVFFLFVSDRLSKIYVIHESEKNLDNYILESTYLNIRLFGMRVLLLDYFPLMISFYIIL